MSDASSPPGDDRPDASDRTDGGPGSGARGLADLETVVEVQPDDDGTDDWWRVTADESRVPADHDGPVAACPYCDRPFESSRARALHVGEDHPDRCTDEERAAYEEADEAERDDLFVYHLKAVVVIGLTWAIFVILYMVAIGTNVV